jgi:hypothetical protein
VSGNRLDPWLRSGRIAPATPASPIRIQERQYPTIEASGAWQIDGSNVSNATGICCWLPGNGCQVVVAELVPEGNRSRFKIVEKSLTIVQLSDAALTATASSTNPCQLETLRVER